MGNNPGARASHKANVKIKFCELLDAFTFSSAGAAIDCYAYINLDSGAVLLVFDDMDINTEQEMPDDLETSDRYLPVPHKNDLDLGRKLVLSLCGGGIARPLRNHRGFLPQKRRLRSIQRFS